MEKKTPVKRHLRKTNGRLSLVKDYTRTTKGSSGEGIPDRTNFKKIPSKDGFTNFVVHEHLAKRAGKHYDLRLNIGGDAHSWALRTLPEPGETKLAVQQPTHCFPPGVKVRTPVGDRPIEDIKKGDLVYAMDRAGLIVERKVEAALVGTAESLVRFDARVGKRGGSVLSTPGHRVLTTEGKVPAADLHGKSPLFADRCLSDEQLSLAIGTFFGDGNITKGCGLRVCHGKKQRNYLAWKAAQLGATSWEGKHGKIWMSRSGSQLIDLLGPALSAGKKEFTPELLRRMGPRGLAVLYCDDGAMWHVGNDLLVEFSVQGYSLESIIILKKWLLSLDIESRILRSEHDRRWNAEPPTDRELFRLRLDRRDAVKTFFELVGPFIPEVMAYKVPLSAIETTRACSGCGGYTRLTRKFCSACLLTDAKGVRPSKYSGLVTSHAIYERFGEWPTEFTRVEEDELLFSYLEHIDWFSRSSCSREIDRATRGWIRRGPVEVAYTGPVYNLTVEIDHNYVLSTGLIVGNSTQYMAFKGEIADGYGAGTVNIHDSGRVEIIEADDSKVVFNRYEGKKAHEYALLRLKDKDWLLINRSTVPGKYKYPQFKDSYRTVPFDDSIVDKYEGHLQPKIDGAHAIVLLRANKRPRVFSYRESKKGDVLEYTHKIPELFKNRVPTGLGTQVLRAEVYLADKSGRALPAERTAGVLNSGVERARELQEGTGGLKIAVFDVVGKEEPYTNKHKKLKELARLMPYLTVPETAETSAKKRQLVEKIRSGKHRVTREGVVLWPKDGSKPIKAKITDDRDVYVREVFEGKGKYEDTAAGGFTYSRTPAGPIVGKVGTGLSDSLRKELRDNKDKLSGRVATVTFNKEMPSGALHGPRFLRWHPDKDRGNY